MIISGAIIKCMSDAEITKLSKDMQKGFAGINKRFESVDKRFDAAEMCTDKIDEQLDRLTKIVIKGFDNIDKVLETKANSIDLQKVMTSLDALMKLQEITDDERLVMASQLTRLHEWVEQAAKRIDLKFVR